MRKSAVNFMTDKLYKQRFGRIDYELIIKVLGLTYDFTSYLFKKRSQISIRRSARSFLLINKVDIKTVFCFIKTQKINNHIDFLKATDGKPQGLFYL